MRVRVGMGIQLDEEGKKKSVYIVHCGFVGFYTYRVNGHMLMWIHVANYSVRVRVRVRMVIFTFCDLFDKQGGDE